MRSSRLVGPWLVLAWSLAVACSSTPAWDATPNPPAVPSRTSPTAATPTRGSDAPSPPAISVDIVTADWTRAIEAAVGGRDVSVAVGAGERILFVHMGGKPRIPASNQKLLTSMAALDIFGRGHRFPTTAAARRAPRSGAIRGDLWLVGSGDPELDAASMVRLADAVRAGGVTSITGGVIGDTSAFTREWWAPGWVPGLSRSYVTRTTALAFEQNAGSGLPEAAAASSFTAALRARGVEVAREPSAGEAPLGLDPVALTRSRPLRDLLGVQNHGSVNFYAETLLKAIGAEAEHDIGSTAAGAEAVAAWAASLGVIARVMDGSGLSHQDRVSAQGLATLLLLGQGEPWGGVLDTSLAPPGDGTLDGRLIGVPVRAKTGTLFETPVSSLSGYVTDAGGTRVAFSVISRGLEKGTAIAIEDAIVRALAGGRIG
jgi:D-alanyl-D-alanine carboxypeptidase/D-alanyl-D-alanine-endopeptidase (penicillin-binding protein 4)